MRKLSLMLVVAIGIVGAANSQDQADMSAMFKVPEEVKKLDSMVGVWEGEEKLYFGPSPMTAKVKITISKVMNGRWMEELHEYESPAMMKIMVGKMLTTYDADKKVWNTYWFDSGSASAISMKGKDEGNAHISISEAFEMPGFPGKMISRATWTKKSATEATFKFETAGADEESKKQAAAMGAKGEWTTIIEGTYKKKK